jgi:hypothetical protein
VQLVQLGLVHYFSFFFTSSILVSFQPLITDLGSSIWFAMIPHQSNTRCNN